MLQCSTKHKRFVTAIWRRGSLACLFPTSEMHIDAGRCRIMPYSHGPHSANRRSGKGILT